MLIEENSSSIVDAKGRISVRSNTKVTAVTAPRILVFIYHLWHNDYRKKYYLLDSLRLLRCR